MRVGVLGGGQLGLMLAEAGRALSHVFRFLDPSREACARSAGELIVGALDDPEALDRFSEGLDLVTYEFENVPVESVNRLAAKLPVVPGAESLRIAQDRLLEKRLFAESGFQTAPFLPVDSTRDLEVAVRAVGLPGVLKARRGGYDGRSQSVVQSEEEIPAAWDAIGAAPAIYEAFIPFTRELSLVSVRSGTGETAFYPLVENRHEGGILRVTTAPAPDVDASIESEAHEHARALMDRLDHVGVLTVEFFQVQSTLLANEFAPRVHNSGHWTIEGSRTSQFESHMRAITGAPLTDTRTTTPSVMLNLIGSAPDADEMRVLPHVHVHMYGKAPRPGRKIGHCTISGATPDETRAAQAQLEAIVAHWDDDKPDAP